MPRLALPEVPERAASPRVDLEQLVQCHFSFIWRLLRRLGLPASDADDAAQQVFLTASGKLDSIRSGSERAFLYGCALHLSARWQRARARDRRSVSLEGEHAEGELPAAGSGSSAEDLLDRSRARAVLDAVLDAMPDPLRTVFVLFELEQLSTLQIAELLELPRGTVASRLRRAREDFEKRVKRLEAQRAQRGSRG